MRILPSGDFGILRRCGQRGSDSRCEAIREELSLKPGQKIQAIVLGDKIELVPIADLATAKGFLPGLNGKVDRESDRV